MKRGAPPPFVGGFSLLVGLVIFCFAGGCHPQAALRTSRAAQASAFRRLAVGTIQGEGGAEIARELAHQLKESGVAVVDQRQAPDAILGGQVIEYKPHETLLVVLGSVGSAGPNGSSVVQSNPVISFSGNPAASPVLAVGNHPQVVSALALIGVHLNLVDPSFGRVVWSHEYSYEELDVPSTVRLVVGHLIESLGSVVPSIHVRSRSPGTSSGAPPKS